MTVDVLSFVIAMTGSVLAIVGVMIALFLWNRGEANSDRRDIVNLIIAIKEDVNAMQTEMKDFHGRLERQDAEFRTRFLAIEERRVN